MENLPFKEPVDHTPPAIDNPGEAPDNYSNLEKDIDRAFERETLYEKIKHLAATALGGRE